MEAAPVPDDVITLDLEMPRIDGMETLRLIMQPRSASGDSLQHAFERRRVLDIERPSHESRGDFIGKPTDRCRSGAIFEKIADYPHRKRSKSPKRYWACKLPRRRPFPSILRSGAGSRYSLRLWLRRGIIAIGVSTGGPERATIPTLRSFRRISRALYPRRAAHARSASQEMFSQRWPRRMLRAGRQLKPSQATYSTPAAFSSAPAIAT